MIKLYSFFLLIFALPLSSFSQFEGLVVYEVAYEATEEAKKEMLSMLPKKSVLYVKDKRSLFEQEVAGGGRQAFFIDAGKGSGVLVMQFLGQGYKVEMSQEEMESLKKAKELEVLTTDEKKTIAGYTCARALAISDTDTLELFYSIELESESRTPPFTKVKGIPLKYELIRGGVKMIYTAVEVKETTIDEAVFNTAPDLKSMDFENFARSFAISQ
ncbi:hypothetical protein O3Q51_15190 [Cryomorphaceae bacterium 1068]|nr:hypothetical protein [Cryomorphaceae bacterium 1068]